MIYHAYTEKITNIGMLSSILEARINPQFCFALSGCTYTWCEDTSQLTHLLGLQVTQAGQTC